MFLSARESDVVVPECGKRWEIQSLYRYLKTSIQLQLDFFFLFACR